MFPRLRNQPSSDETNALTAKNVMNYSKLKPSPWNMRDLLRYISLADNDATYFKAKTVWHIGKLKPESTQFLPAKCILAGELMVNKISLYTELTIWLDFCHFF